MKVINAIDAFKDKGAKGLFILIYGDTNVGKTCSSIQSLWGTTIGIFTEPRDIEPNVEASGRDLTVNPFYFDFWKDFNDLRAFLVNHDNFKDVDTILFDGISHAMHLVGKEMAKDDFESKYDKELKAKSHIDKALSKEMKMSLESYGTMANGMLLIVELLGDLVKTGKTVVCTARLDEPDAARKSMGKVSAPLYKGKMFGNDVSAWFDLIGLVKEAHTLDVDKAEQPAIALYKTEEGKSVYKSAVPSVSFNLTDAVTKRTGIAPDDKKGWNGLLLDFRMICRVDNNTTNGGDK